MPSIQYIIDLETYNREDINSKTVQLKDGRNYTILNYNSNKESLNTLVDTSGKYRSVILSESGKLLSFAPPKSINIDEFQNNYSIEDLSIVVNEVIEGTMINLFFDAEKSIWEIATKASIGGNYWYFRNKYPCSDNHKRQEETMSIPELTFRQMFVNALGMEDHDDLQDSNILTNLDKKYCYSFILQHPSNHIVSRIIAPTIYLVAVYEIFENTVKVVDPNEYEYWPNIYNSLIRVPKRFINQTYTDIKLQKCSIDSTYDIPGVMFLNTATGKRACMENEAYKKVRELRGNNPNLQFQYLSLKSQDKIGEFLIHFDQYTDLFGKFERQYDNFIRQVHNGYVNYYVKKTGNTVPKQYFPLVYKVHHEVFIPSVASGEKIIVKREVVADYINKIDPKSLIYYLNWKDENQKPNKRNKNEERDEEGDKENNQETIEEQPQHKDEQPESQVE